MNEMTLEDAIAFIQRGNCPDCFHPECLRRADLARALIELEREDPMPAMTADVDTRRQS